LLCLGQRVLRNFLCRVGHSLRGLGGPLRFFHRLLRLLCLLLGLGSQLLGLARCRLSSIDKLLRGLRLLLSGLRRGLHGLGKRLFDVGLLLPGAGHITGELAWRNPRGERMCVLCLSLGRHRCLLRFRGIALRLLRSPLCRKRLFLTRPGLRVLRR